MDIIMPQLGETVTEGVVTKWYKQVGDTVRADEILFDVETDKVSTEIPSPVAGVLAEIRVASGVTAKVGVCLAVVREVDQAGSAAIVNATAKPVAAQAAAANVSVSAQTAIPKGRAADRLSPVVRRLVAEHQLNPALMNGTGRDGRITREDALQWIAKCNTNGASPSTTSLPASSPSPASARVATTSVAPGPVHPFNHIRKKVAENTVKSWQTAPHVLQVAEADFYRVEQARSEYGTAWQAREGFVLTYLPFIVRAVSIALAQFPKLNASLQGEGLVLHPRINIGIAVDLNFDGLLVPVLKDVPSKSLPQIAKEIYDLATRARAGRLRPDEMTEGTYTITNNGAFGTVITAPIILQPQVAILSADAIRKKPVVVESETGDAIAIRPIGVLAQSFDHRAVDGAYSAAFLSAVRKVIETRHWSQDLQA
jgi:2-oxoglutarate dehydrogenase E2 component (dihydrolipoamide succinyltransferase)